MKYLLDTCVISELVSKQPHAQVVTWVDSLEDERTFLSVLTIGEIKRGVAKLPDSKRKTQLQTWLHNDLLIRFQGRILPLDTQTLLNWGTLVANLEQKGRTLPAIDSLIAALALTHTLHLVTRNEKDFIHTSVSIHNPWT